MKPLARKASVRPSKTTKKNLIKRGLSNRVSGRKKEIRGRLARVVDVKLNLPDLTPQCTEGHLKFVNVLKEFTEKTNHFTFTNISSFGKFVATVWERLFVYSRIRNRDVAELRALVDVDLCKILQMAVVCDLRTNPEVLYLLWSPNRKHIISRDKTLLLAAEDLSIPCSGIGLRFLSQQCRQLFGFRSVSKHFCTLLDRVITEIVVCELMHRKQQQQQQHQQQQQTHVLAVAPSHGESTAKAGDFLSMTHVRSLVNAIWNGPGMANRHAYDTVQSRIGEAVKSFIDTYTILPNRQLLWIPFYVANEMEHYGEIIDQPLPSSENDPLHQLFREVCRMSELYKVPRKSKEFLEFTYKMVVVNARQTVRSLFEAA